MADISGDKSKQPAECKVNGAPPTCPNLEQTYQGYDKETWHCEACGEHYNLYYDDKPGGTWVDRDGCEIGNDPTHWQPEPDGP